MTEIFTFTDSQFGALGELPWLLVALTFFTIRWQNRIDRRDLPDLPDLPNRPDRSDAA